MRLDPETVEYAEFRPYIVGIVERAGQPPLLCYDRDAVVQHLAQTMGEDAEEFFEYNTLGSYVGPYTPCFITLDRALVAPGSGAASVTDGSSSGSGPVP